MPVEIKELVIRAVLNSDHTATADSTDNDSVVQECVTQVLKILKKKNRR